MQSGDGLLVRIKPSCGILTLAQVEAIASLAIEHGNGLIELTSRGNLQLRGVSGDALAQLTAELDALGLIDASTEAEAVRNVITSPLAGIDPAAYDTRTLVENLETRLTSDTSLHALSDKFGFLIDGGGTLSLADIEADIRFIWRDGTFAVGLAGETATHWIGSCLPDEVADTAARLASQFLAHADGARRMRTLAGEPRHAIARNVLPRVQTRRPDPIQRSLDESSTQPNTGETPGLRRDDGSEDEATSNEPRELEGEAAPNFHSCEPSIVAPQAPPSADRAREAVGVLQLASDVIALGIGLPYGGTTAATLIELAAILREAKATEVRLTPWRAVIAPIATEAASPALLARVAALGLIADPADPRRAIAACPGGPACASGTTPVRADADLLASATAAILRDGATLHVSGCAKGCARRQPATLTLVADAGRYGLVVNGAAGAPARGRFTAAEAADLLARLASAMTQAGTTTGTCKTAAIAAALKEIQAA